MSDESDLPGWTGATRQDGISVRENRDGFWRIDRPGQESIRLCPCCERPMRNELAAKRVCDQLFPIGVATPTEAP